jgi:hypothetical protein
MSSRCIRCWKLRDKSYSCVQAVPIVQTVIGGFNDLNGLNILNYLNLTADGYFRDKFLMNPESSNSFTKRVSM